MKNYKIIKNKIELESLELSSLTTKIKDGTHSSFKDSNNKDSKILYSAKNIKNSNIIEGKNERRISLEDYKKIVNNGFPKKGDILLTIVGTIGESMIWNKEHSEAFQRSVAFIRCNNLIIPEYLKYAFKSNYLKNDISRRIKVGAQPGIYLKDLAKLKIKITTISQQKRIAEVLSKQESIINKTKDLIEQLEKRNTFMLDELLSGRLRIKEENGQVEFYKNPDDNWQTVLMNDENINLPKEWSTINLGDRGISFIKTGIEKFDGNKQYYATGSITKFKMDKEPTEIVSYDNRTSRANLDIKDNSIYFARMKDTLKVLRFKTKDNKILSTGFLGLQVDINKFNLDFIFFNIISNYFQKNKDKNCNGATQKSLSDASAKKIKIIFPNLDEQYKISIIMNNLYNEKEKYEELLIEEQKKFDFLLEELMSGRLRIEE